MLQSFKRSDHDSVPDENVDELHVAVLHRPVQWAESGEVAQAQGAPRLSDHSGQNSRNLDNAETD